MFHFGEIYFPFCKVVPNIIYIYTIIRIFLLWFSNYPIIEMYFVVQHLISNDCSRRLLKWEFQFGNPAWILLVQIYSGEIVSKPDALIVESLFCHLLLFGWFESSFDWFESSFDWIESSFVPQIKQSSVNSKSHWLSQLQNAVAFRVMKCCSESVIVIWFRYNNNLPPRNPPSPPGDWCGEIYKEREIVMKLNRISKYSNRHELSVFDVYRSKATNMINI